MVSCLDTNRKTHVCMSVGTSTARICMRSCMLHFTTATHIELPAGHGGGNIRWKFSYLIPTCSSTWSHTCFMILARGSYVLYTRWPKPISLHASGHEAQRVFMSDFLLRSSRHALTALSQHYWQAKAEKAILNTHSCRNSFGAIPLTCSGSNFHCYLVCPTHAYIIPLD